VAVLIGHPVLKFNSDEKQFTRLFIFVFASDCILSPTNGDRPLWWWVGPECSISEWTSTSRVILCQDIVRIFKPIKCMRRWHVYSILS